MIVSKEKEVAKKVDAVEEAKLLWQKMKTLKTDVQKRKT
jgi:hypothetical protein